MSKYKVPARAGAFLYISPFTLPCIKIVVIPALKIGYLQPDGEEQFC